MEFSILGLPCIIDPEMHAQHCMSLLLVFCSLKMKIIMSLNSHGREAVEALKEANFCI